MALCAGNGRAFYSLSSFVNAFVKIGIGRCPAAWLGSSFARRAQCPEGWHKYGTVYHHNHKTDDELAIDAGFRQRFN